VVRKNWRGEPSGEIRDSHLYRQQFQTFEAYCRERWGLKERHAYKLMDAAAVVENLQTCPIGQLPKTESQARPLTRLEPEVQREVWQEVVTSTPADQITARVVEEKANSTNAALWAGLAGKMRLWPGSGTAESPQSSPHCGARKTYHRELHRASRGARNGAPPRARARAQGAENLLKPTRRSTRARAGRDSVG